MVSQVTDFNYEIIIGEDDSKDNTRKICIELAEKHPEKIRLFLRDRKDVIYHNGSPTGRFNFLENLKAARGKYIAVCEGDDYWIDNSKLQNQVDFLEKNEQYVATTTNTYYLKKNELKFTYIGSKEAWLNRKIKNEILYTDIPFRLFPHLSSWLFLNKIIDYKLNFSVFTVGDMAMLMILANKGKINYSSDITSVYRIHDNGAIGALKKHNPLEVAISFAKMYNYLDKVLGRNNDNETDFFIINDHIRLLKDNPSFRFSKEIIKQLNKLKKNNVLKKTSFISVKVFTAFIITAEKNRLKKIKQFFFRKKNIK